VKDLCCCKLVQGGQTGLGLFGLTSSQITIELLCGTPCTVGSYLLLLFVPLVVALDFDNLAGLEEV
jgi:hypothetical protein